MTRVITERVAPRYMRDFACIGAACPEHCCAGWDIEIDRTHFVELRRVMRQPPALRAQFDRAFAQAPDAERTRTRFATVRHDASHACPMLSRDGLCTIHQRFGEALLPDVCASYPRVVDVDRAEGRIELMGVLSCPEAARLALLQPSATDLVTIGERRLGRTASLGGDDTAEEKAPPTGHHGHLDAIRGAMYELAGRDEYTLEQRLFMQLCLAQELDARFDGRHPAPTATELDAALRAAAQPEQLDALAGTHAELAPEDGPNLGPVLQALSLCEPTTGQPTFLRLRGQVFASYGLDERFGTARQDPLARIGHDYLQRRASVLAVLGERIHTYGHSYARYFWLRERLPAAPTLHRHLQVLLLRLAMLRFLLLSHPAATEAAARREPAALDKLAVEICFSLSRYVEHSSTYTDSVLQLIGDELPHFADSLSLLAI